MPSLVGLRDHPRGNRRVRMARSARSAASVDDGSPLDCRSGRGAVAESRCWQLEPVAQDTFLLAENYHTV